MMRFVVRGLDEAATFEFANALERAFRRATYEVNLERGWDLANPPRDEEEEETPIRDAQGRNVAPSVARRRRRPPLVARTVGPAPAPFAKLRGYYRFHFQALGGPSELLREAASRLFDPKFLASLSTPVKRPRDVQWIVDVDPLDSL